MAHTPGPWQVYLDHRISRPAGRFHGIVAGNCTIVLFGEEDEGDMGIHGRTIEEDHANARLIAAAPELLVACEKAMQALVLPSLKLTDDAIAMLAEAMTKAGYKGEPK